MMLSFEDDWRYLLNGLAAISRGSHKTAFCGAARFTARWTFLCANEPMFAGFLFEAFL